jgi:hypothetical protein
VDRGGAGSSTLGLISPSSSLSSNNAAKGFGIPRLSFLSLFNNWTSTFLLFFFLRLCKHSEDIQESAEAALAATSQGI